MGGGSADVEGALDRSRGIRRWGWKNRNAVGLSAEREGEMRNCLKMRSAHWVGGGGQKKLEKGGG